MTFVHISRNMECHWIYVQTCFVVLRNAAKILKLICIPSHMMNFSFVICSPERVMSLCDISFIPLATVI